MTQPAGTIAQRGTTPASYHQALVDLARRSSFAQGCLDDALRDLTEAAAHTLAVQRASVWLLDPGRTRIECRDLYERDRGLHSQGSALSARDYPAYFAALDEARMIPATDARTDPRTREFAAAYLEPLGITSMLDAPVRLGGRIAGVVCHEHVGPRRDWTPQEQDFAASVGDFVSLVLERDALVRSQRRLEAEIRERERAEEAVRRASKLEAIGRLAGGIAHDFNNLLTVILGHADALARELPAGHAHRASAEEIVAAARRASTLTRQLLAFGRRQVLRPQVLDPLAVLRGLEPLLGPMLGEKWKLSMRPRGSFGRVRADAAQLDQMLINLVLNARDAMPAGGTIEVEVGDATAAEVAEAFPDDPPSGEFVVLLVRDSGIGMDAPTRAHLFEPFFTTKPPGKGTGLGLATVHGIVHQSGGGIAVQSTLGAGTTFKICLPRESAAATAPPSLEPGTLRERGSETVLLVDDNSAVRKVAQRTLELAGYRVLVAAGGEDALEQARAFGPGIHLLVTDLVMQGIDGHQLAERLTADRQELRVLYVSGHTERPQQPGPRGRSFAFLAKPFTPAELARAVRGALDRSAAGAG